MKWLELLPRVQPLYALKSNYDCFVLKLMSYLGVGFDCSSKGEIETLMLNNISPDRILFANPNKQISHIIYSNKIGVNKMVFDNEYELLKLKRYHPKAECILRIKCDCLPSKFGADLEQSMYLIKKSIELNIKLIGISFYVGFRQRTAQNIIESIKNARHLFDYARENFNYIMYILDIGGGFPGTWQTRNLFEQMAQMINQVLDEYFPVDYFDLICEKSNCKFKIIAELGTYYTSSAYTLCVNVTSKKEQKLTDQDKQNIVNNDKDPNSSQSKKIINGVVNSLITDDTQKNCNYMIDQTKKFIYCINDSIHASFKWYDLNEGLPIFAEQRTHLDSCPFYLSSIGGATCDSTDFILKDCFMPELDLEEYLIFRNMGSYTKTAAAYFNDIPLPETIFVSTRLWDILKNCIHCKATQDHYAASILNSKSIIQNENSYKNAIDRLFNVKS